jgi:hypothetical protein
MRHIDYFLSGIAKMSVEKAAGAGRASLPRPRVGASVVDWYGTLAGLFKYDIKMWFNNGKICSLQTECLN